MKMLIFFKLLFLFGVNSALVSLPVQDNFSQSALSLYVAQLPLGYELLNFWISALVTFP